MRPQKHLCEHEGGDEGAKPECEMQAVQVGTGRAAMYPLEQRVAADINGALAEAHQECDDQQQPQHRSKREDNGPSQYDRQAGGDDAVAGQPVIEATSGKRAEQIAEDQRGADGNYEHNDKYKR